MNLGDISGKKIKSSSLSVCGLVGFEWNKENTERSAPQKRQAKIVWE